MRRRVTRRKTSNILWTAVCSGWAPRDWTWCCCIARPHRYTKRTNFSPVWTSWWKRERLPLYGVSIEKVTEGLQALEYPISAIEVVFNMFRPKPVEELFPKAQAQNVGILARVPLASGLLTGRYTKDTVFGPKDHRSFNRHGESFDKGETFSGVDYELGLQAVAELKQLFGTDHLIPYALRWILMHDAVSAVIPGASKAEQVLANVKAAEQPPLTPEQMQGVARIYDRYLRASIHPNW